MALQITNVSVALKGLGHEIRIVLKLYGWTGLD
jgi:hypothetical protein